MTIRRNQHAQAAGPAAGPERTRSETTRAETARHGPRGHGPRGHGTARRNRGRGGGTVARMALVLAAAAAMVAFGRFLDEPSAAAETLYLALLAAPLLAAVAVLEPGTGYGGPGIGGPGIGRLPTTARPAAGARTAGTARADLGLLPWAAVLTVLAVWIVEPGPGRGAAVVALLGAFLAWSGGRRLALAGAGADHREGGWIGIPARYGSASREAAPAPPAPGTAAPAAGAGGREEPAGKAGTAAAPPGGAPAPPAAGEISRVLDLAAALVPLVVGLQVLLRSRDLLGVEADLRSLVVLAAYPAVAGLALALLARRHGLAAALLAGATAVLATGSLNRSSVLALAALAAGELLRRPWGATPAARRAWRLLAVAVLLTPFAWQLRIPGLALAAAALLAWPVRAAAPVAALGVGAAVLFPIHGWTRSVDLLGWSLLLLPVLPVALAAGAVVGGGGGRSRGGAAAVAVRTAPLAGALLLVLAAARAAPWGGLAAPLALLALSLKPALAAPAGGPDNRSGAGPGSAKDGGAGNGGAEVSAAAPLLRQAVAVQGVWSGLLLAATVLAAAYPWLRHGASLKVLDGIGLDPTGGAPLVVATGALLAVLAALPPASPGVRRAGAALLVTGLLVVALLLRHGSGTTLLGNPGVLLTAGEPRVEVRLAEAGAGRSGSAAPDLSRLALFGSLAYGEGVLHGTPVARVRLLQGEAEVAGWTVRAGDDLAEWAAGRPGVAAALAHDPPAPWASWVADGAHYGRTYRALHPLEGTVRADRLVVERDPDLPPGVAVHLRRLEGWR